MTSVGPYGPGVLRLFSRHNKCARRHPQSRDMIGVVGALLRVMDTYPRHQFLSQSLAGVLWRNDTVPALSDESGKRAVIASRVPLWGEEMRPLTLYTDCFGTLDATLQPSKGGRGLLWRLRSLDANWSPGGLPQRPLCPMNVCMGRHETHNGFR